MDYQECKGDFIRAYDVSFYTSSLNATEDLSECMASLLEALHR